MTANAPSSDLETPLTLVVVGGVAGGASAATRARRLNEKARILLFEKDEDVSFANCGMPYYLGGEIKDRSALLVTTPQRLLERFRIEVYTSHEVTHLDRSRKMVTVRDRRTDRVFEQPYDKLILSPGASPLIPQIEGLQAFNVFSLRNLFDMDRIHAYLKNRMTKRALVVGAGYVGLEMVEQLHRHGLKVTVVELADQVLTPLDPELACMAAETLTRQGVDVFLGDAVEALESHQGLAKAARLRSGAVVETDLVILGAGVRANHGLAKDAGLEVGPTGGIRATPYGQTLDPDIYAVGDAAEYVHAIIGSPLRVPLAGPANRAGRLAGEHAVTGHSAPQAPVLGTAIVRVFDLTLAGTGLNEKTAQKLGIPVASVYVEARHHAGYYPGAQSMILKLTYCPNTGRILGAQAVGGEGVDKRIDVIATAMHFGGTVEQLAGVDLAYAPPFGSAKDPVHMAAFAASNQRAGLAEFLPPGADLQDWQTLDVRTEAEVQERSVPYAKHIPLDELRNRLNELDRSRPTAVLCRSGLRAWVAARVLKGSGFDRVAVVSGGLLVRTRTGAR